MSMVMLRGISARLMLAVLGAALSTGIAHAGLILQTATYNGNTYYLVGNSGGAGITFTDAESYAITLGGHLATINNAAENAFVTSTFAPLTSSNVGGLWIGLNDRAVENTYVWTSGQTSSYRNFNTGEPNHSSVGPNNPPGGIPEDPTETVEDYVFIYGNDGPTDQALNGKWDDYFDIDNIYQFNGAPLYGVVEVPGVATAATPEPATLTLLGVGLSGLMGYGWRRKRKAAAI